LWNAEVITDFVYNNSLQLTINSIASWVRPRLIFFKVTAKNISNRPLEFTVKKSISDSLTASLLTGKLINLRKKEM
jgi:hypothetical protein